MTPAQIQAIRGSGKKIAAIVTTRNATFWIVDQEGRDHTDPNCDARYELIEWDDANEMLILRTQNLIRSDQFGTLLYISYAPIDEMIILDA
jgi:hypothetical protein